MSLNWANALGSVGAGMAHGLATVKEENKANEQLNYDRNRQGEIDRQNLEKHNQQVEQNKYVLQDTARKAAEIQRRDSLGKIVGQYQQYQQLGDMPSALKLYADNANKDNLGNSNWDPNNQLSFSKEKDGTYNLNVVDKNTGALVSTAKSGVTFDDLISQTYGQIDPLGSHEAVVASKAKIAEEERKNLFERTKLGLQYKYDIDKQNNQGNIDVQKTKFKHDYDIELENLRQDGAYSREELQQEGQNYRLDSKNGGKSLTPLNLASLTVNAESGNKHYGKDGGLLRSYDPTSSARGAGQFTTATRNMVLKASGIDAYKSPEEALKATAWYQQHNQNILGDVKAGFIAHYAGAGAVQSWMKQAKQQGVPWESLIPAKYQARAKLFDKYAGSSMPNNQTAQDSTTKSDFSNNIAKATNNQIDAVSSAMTTELGFEGKKSAAVIGGLSGAQAQIAKFVGSKSYEARSQAYNAIFGMVQRVVDSTETGALMSPQAKLEYSHQKAAELVGASNKIEAGQWIRNGSRPSSQAATQNSANNAPQFDFSDISVADVSNNTPKPKAQNKAKEQPKAEKKTATNPLYTKGLSDAVNGNKKAFIPYKSAGTTTTSTTPTFQSNLNKYTNNPFS